MIKISTKQRGNNVIEYLKGTTWEYCDQITTDYEVNIFISIIFLSLRFHLCKPEYIYKKLKSQRKYRVQILLVYVDLKNYERCIYELFFIADKHNYTMILSFSNEEAAKYIKGFAAPKNINMIRKKVSDEFGQYECFFTSFPKINKTDASLIMENSRSIFDIAKNGDTIKNIKGVGNKKIEMFTLYLDKSFNSKE